MNLIHILNKIFSSDKNSKELTENIINYEIASQDQIDFANGAIEVFNPLMKQFRFKLLKLKITEYGTTIIWIKEKCYVDLGGNTHPHDAPSYYGIALGEFKEDYYHYSDLDCVGLWRLKSIQENIDSIKDTAFPLKMTSNQV